MFEVFDPDHDHYEDYNKIFKLRPRKSSHRLVIKERIGSDRYTYYTACLICSRGNNKGKEIARGEEIRFYGYLSLQALVYYNPDLFTRKKS